MSLAEASDPKTKSARLVELSQSTEASIVNAVAKNPSTPIETLLLLAERCPSIFLENPVLPLLLLEDPTFLHAAAPEAAQALLRVPSVPTWVSDSLTSNPNTSIRATVAGNANTPIPILELLATDQNEEVRSGVAANANTPIPILELLSTDQHPDVRYNVAGNANTPTPILELLATDSDE
jgi:hypothetical protein